MIGRSIAIVVVGASLLAGCAVRSDLMSPTGETATTLRPEPGKALVVFVRPEYVGYAIQAVVYDGEEFIGVVSRHTAVPYHAAPGVHRFMVVSEAADFVDAELGEGRTYFVEVVPRMGMWRARFSALPLSASGDAAKIGAALADSRVVAPNADGRRWATNNHPSAMKKKAAYEPKWLEKGARPTLRVEDGTPPAVVPVAETAAP